MERLISGQENSSIVFVEDALSTQQYSRLLLNEFVNNLSNRCDVVYFLCCGRSCAYWNGFFHKAKLSRPPVLLDAFQDFLAWNDNQAAVSGNVQRIHDTTDIAKTIRGDVSQRLPSADNITVGLICDDIGPMLAHSGLKAFSRFVTNLSMKNEDSNVRLHQAVFFVHGDCHGGVSLASLLYKSRAYVELLAGADQNKEPGDVAFSCRLRTKKTSGKYSNEVYAMKYLPGIGLRQVTSSSKSTRIAIESGQQGEVDPTTNLSFSLKLTDAEKEARSRLVLPYTQASHPVRSLDEGKVFYHPDEVDDYDEEDPDDDLNI